jgi:hypothetical protein
MVRDTFSGVLDEPCRGTEPSDLGESVRAHRLAHAAFVPGIPSRRKLGAIRGDRSALGDECVKRSRVSN